MNGVISQSTRERLHLEPKQAINNIKNLAREQYQLEVMKERNQRRWVAGERMLPAFLLENRNISWIVSSRATTPITLRRRLLGNRQSRTGIDERSSELTSTSSLLSKGDGRQLECVEDILFHLVLP